LKSIKLLILIEKPDLRVEKMKKRMLLATILALTLTLTLAMKPASAVDTLTPNDFKQQSFSKTLDFFNFCRTYANQHNKTGPPSNWHAYLYQNYINSSGFQLYYSGLINITAGAGGALIIPVQSFIEHFKTPNGKDVLTSSSFIMLLAFNDTASSLHDDSPDRNDNLYASFSLGFDLSSITGSTNPAQNSKTELIPLTHPDDNTWEWGMRYTNLTAIWWRMYINPLNPHFEALPIAITTYDELTFTYKLELDPANNTAKLTSNYVIGRMTNLWLIWWLLLIPVVAHYNATGTYRPNGTQIGNQTIYQFLEEQHIKMSIVLFQNSLVLDYTTKSTFNNQNVTDADIDVSNGDIITEAGNEDIFKAEFGAKKQYNLYNYTADQTETDFETYDAVTRTAPRTGYAKNSLFSIHVALLNYVPVIVKHIAPELYQKALTYMLNMTYADYFYLISYPTYSGFKVEHDPTYTAYIATPETSETITQPNLAGLFGLIIIAVIVVAVIGTVLVLRRRGTKTQATPPSTLTPSSPEPTTPTNP
jgi:hypothetical protein